MNENNKFTIFLLDDIPDNLNVKIISKYHNAQLFLENYYKTKVINPIIFFQNNNISRDEAFKNYFAALIDCDSVYLLNDSDGLVKNNYLLKLAIHLNKIIMYEPLDLTEFLKPSHNKVKKVFGR